MTNISRAIFWKMIKPELAYYNKKWDGSTDKEKRENERNVLSMYYKSLSVTSEYSLEIALNRHRESETTFPKIPQLLKFIPRKSETYETKAYKRTPMPDSVSVVADNVNVGEEMKRKMAQLVIERYGTSRDEANKIFNCVT